MIAGLVVVGDQVLDVLVVGKGDAVDLLDLLERLAAGSDRPT